MNFPTLLGKSPQEWDQIIGQELEYACIAPSVACTDIGIGRIHTLNGALGGWTFVRRESCYWFWGDIPLAIAETIAVNSACAHGCLSGQWYPITGHQFDDSAGYPTVNPEHIEWVDDAGCVYMQKGEMNEVIEQMYQSRANWKLRFVENPRAVSRPFVRAFTFTTPQALRAFVAITRTQCLEFKSTII